MRKISRGFTLIELMIVVAIVGTLAAIAIPAYQDYTIRAQIAEGISLAAGAQTALEDYYAQHGAWPGNNADAALADQNDIIGKYTEHVSVTNEVIEVQYAFEAHVAIQGKTILLTAANNSGSVSWSCTGVGIPDNQLPRACRAGAAPAKKKKGSKG